MGGWVGNRESDSVVCFCVCVYVRVCVRGRGETVYTWEFVGENEWGCVWVCRWMRGLVSGWVGEWFLGWWVGERESDLIV